MPPPLRVVFLGSDPIALPMLDWLAARAAAPADGGGLAVQIGAIYTQPDRPAGRGQKVEAGPIKRWALAHKVPVRQPEKLTPEECAWFAAQEPDLALVLAYGHILRDDWIAVPQLGTLNLHASILPRYRGASPIQTAVACGERATGVTLMRVVRKLDAGPVADAERVLIEPLDTTVEIERKLSVACVPLVARALPRLAGGELEFKAQDETVATYCRRLNKDDGRLDFAASAAALAARINGLHPWPGCTVEINGTPVKLGLADAVAEVGDPGYNTAKPGTVIGSDSEGLLVATGGGVLRLRRLQRPGGRMLTAPEFLRGFPVAVGTVLSSRPMSKLVGDRPLR